MIPLDLLFWGITLGFIGKVLLGVTVVQVHWKIVKEHKIDKKVLTEMRRERNIAIVAIACIVVGFLLEVSGFGYFAGGLSAFFPN